jgi:integrase
MPAQSITDKFVRNVKLPKKDGDKQVRYIDTLERGLALVLKVSYGGSKTWSVLTYRNGKPHTYGLGKYPQVTLKQAREQAREYFENPEKVTNAAAVGSFKDVAEKWFAREKAQHRTAHETRRQLEKYVYARWKDVPFLQIKRRDIADLIDIVEDNHGPRMADAVLSTIRNICAWWQARDQDYTSPVVPGMGRDQNKARERTLTDAEIATVWKAAEGTFGGIVKMLLLTAQRRAKVQSMRWSDVSADGIWTIATEPGEKGNPGKIKLPQAALDIIHQQPRIAGNPYIFASTARHGRAFYNFALAKRMLDAKTGVNNWVLHDLRRTARSLMSRARVGISFEHRERVLGHALPGVVGTYDRHTYEQEIGIAVAKLAAEIGRIVNPHPPANVVTLERK